ncbi:Protein of unknown function [Bacillus mycoides]|nr:Protein of unknown function [Bacillus mycoides]
MLLLGKIAT